MSMDPDSLAQLRSVFRAIVAEVQRAQGGHVEVWVFCGPGGKVLDWHVDPARVKVVPRDEHAGELLRKVVDGDVGPGSKSPR